MPETMNYFGTLFHQRWFRVRIFKKQIRCGLEQEEELLLGNFSIRSFFVFGLSCQINGGRKEGNL